MKRFWVGGAALAFLVLPGGAGFAQSTLDALTEELNEVQQQHSEATAQSLSNFFSQVDQAMASSDAAVALWQKAGGTLPAPTPVTTVHDTESASEREARQAQDKANADALAAVLQVHCGLLHYAALFVIHPDQKGLQDDFNGWLQKMAQVYPSLGVLPPPPQAGDDNGEPRHRRGGGAPRLDFGDLIARPMRDSIITKFLAFKSFGDKEQGAWSVRSIPQLFKADILDPSRATPSRATLDAWDLYIAMEQADEPDADKWTSTDYPPLQFERACDDFAINSGSEKLEVLVKIVQANPTHPQADDWIKRTKKLLDAYKASHGGAAVVQNNAPPSPPPAVTNGNVTVTTVRQGDAEIITTRTNATANPAPPQ